MAGSNVSDSTNRNAVADYLAAVTAKLAGPAAARVAITDELRDGLMETLDTHQARGRSRKEATAAAIAEFGDPATVAAAFGPELGAVQARRVALGLTVATTGRLSRRLGPFVQGATLPLTAAAVAALAAVVADLTLLGIITGHALASPGSPDVGAGHRGCQREPDPSHAGWAGGPPLPCHPRRPHVMVANGDLLDVLVVGAGPTGLTLAAQLQAFGATVRIVDRQLDRVHESRALAVQPRTLEVLRGLGVTEELIARGNDAVGSSSTPAAASSASGSFASAWTTPPTHSCCSSPRPTPTGARRPPDQPRRRGRAGRGAGRLPRRPRHRRLSLRHRDGRTE